MTQEEKQLLLKDLCARLPYGVKMRYKDDSGYEVLCQIDTFYKDVDGFHCLLRTTGPFGGFQDLNELKPYLRPMSSMTDKEKEEYFGNRMTPWVQNEFGESYSEAVMQYRIDFLLEHHFDYRGLIEKGLALETPEGMYE